MNILWIENHVYYFLKKYENKIIDKILLEESLYSLTLNFILLPSAFLSLATDF